LESDFTDVPPITYSQGTIKSPRAGYSSFVISPIGKLFPRGNYQVILYLNDIKEIVLPFRVEKPPNQDVIFTEADYITHNTEGVKKVFYEWTFIGSLVNTVHIMSKGKSFS